MRILGLLIVLFILFAIMAVFVAIATKLRGACTWSQAYQKLSKRYGGNVAGFKKNADRFATGLGLRKPYLYFNYGRTFCRLRNRKNNRFSTKRSTEMLMNWQDRKFQLIVSTDAHQNHLTGRSDLLRQVFIDQPQFQSDFYVSSNQPEVAKRMLNNSVQWLIDQLRRHTGHRELLIKISQGNLLVAKPGYIKSQQDLEDFVQFSLNLFDQLMLIDAEGIDFLNQDEAAIVGDVKCPICSEEVMHEMVVCTRCKTPHCRDCWHYNGQCATFACGEKRFISMAEVQV